MAQSRSGSLPRRLFLAEINGDRIASTGGLAGVLSLYCAGPNHDDDAASRFKADGFGWHAVNPVPPQAFGALAYVFSRASLVALLEWKSPSDRAPADWLIGCFCRDTQRPYMTHSPSFIRHTGEVSSLPEPGGVPECRQCKEFVAEVEECPK